MMVSPDVHIPAGTSCTDFEKEKFEPSRRDQKFGRVSENNNGVAYAETQDTPCTVPLDDVSLVESEIDLNVSSEHELESGAKEDVDLEIGPIESISDENDTQNEEGEPRMTTIIPIPTERAIDSPTVSPGTDIEQGMPTSTNEGNEAQRIDNSYNVTWSAIARGEKMCGTTLPRFFWLMVLLGLIAVLCASVGYLVYSLELLQ
mmetsp:Transcript_7735/g.21515  ORF Transcript_7735/g.21515 Transcript_7735/m.21515 type:complete len:203 (+) Transcript_7735:84-692(+)